MTIFVDADSFPSLARAVICRAVERHRIPAVFVARVNPGLPKSPLIRFMPAPPGADSADDIVVEQAQAGDLAFTHDIPLAARLVEKGVLVLDDRGAVYTSENVRTRLSERQFMAGLRESNLVGSIGKPGRSYGPRELAEFANAFDRELTRRLRQSPA
jgi:uncharacterized protein YaiI (UPF0178 family)